jgi:hypothetical protein
MRKSQGTVWSFCPDGDGKVSHDPSIGMEYISIFSIGDL